MWTTERVCRAIAVGVTGLLSNLAIALVGALLIWWGVEAAIALRGRRYE
jgi:sulfate permease, SulP family